MLTFSDDVKGRVSFTEPFFLCAYFSWTVDIGFGLFLNCKLYNNMWIFVHGANKTEYYK